MPLAGASQTLPQAPQFCASSARFTQAAPQSSKPTSHFSPHSPAVQVALRELDAVTRTLRVVGVYEGHEEQA